MFQIDRCIHRNSHMIKEGQKMQRRDKAGDKDKKKREQTEKTTLTPYKS